MEIAANIGGALVYLLIALLCLSGLILSCLSISGTWLVSLAAILTFFLKGDSFVGWICVGIFLALSAVVEALEFVASSMGVTKKGGSKLASFMAFAGGILGAILGAFIPIPVIGPVIGMFLVSFLLVYAVEYRRLRTHSRAADIATGTILARAAIIILKVAATMGMIFYLSIALVAGAF